MAVTREPYVYTEDDPLNESDPTGLGFELESPEELPCIFPCLPPTVHEGLEESIESVGRGIESAWNEANENEESTDEGEQLLQERTQHEAQCESVEERVKRLRHEGEELLGRRHSPAARERWQEWYDKLSRGDRRLYRKFNGPPPRQHN